MVSRRFFALTLATTLALSASTPVHAQAPADKGAAIVLFDEGRALMKAGKLDEACAKLAASHELRPAAGTLLNLGDCYERRRMTASAWVTFAEAASLAGRAGDNERAGEASRRAAALESQLSRLSIVVAASEMNVTVARDGVDVPRALWGSAVPVDPGPHKIVATTSTGRWEKSIDVAVGRGTTTVEVPASITPTMSTPVAATAPAPVQTDTREPAPAATPSAGLQRPLALVLGGVGIVAAGAGAVFALQADAKWDDARAACPSALRCSARGVQLGEQAGTSADAATGLVIGGAVLVGTAVVLWLTSTPRTRAASSAMLVAR